jgi:hypothetical protein
MKNNLQPKKQHRFRLSFLNQSDQLLLSSFDLHNQAQLVTGFSVFSKNTGTGNFSINFIDDTDNKVTKGLDELKSSPFNMNIEMLDMFGNVIETFAFKYVSVVEILHSGVRIDVDKFINDPRIKDDANNDNWVIKTVYFDYINVINIIHK